MSTKVYIIGISLYIRKFNPNTGTCEATLKLANPPP